MKNKFLIAFVLLVSKSLSFDCEVKADANTYCLAPTRLTGTKGTYVTYEVTHVSGKQVVCIGRGWTYYPKKSWCDWDWWIIGEISGTVQSSFIWDDMTDYPGVQCVSVGEPGAITWSFSVGTSDVTCMNNASKDRLLSKNSLSAESHLNLLYE